MSAYIQDYFSFDSNGEQFYFSERSTSFSGGENIAVQQSAIAPVYSPSSTYAVGDVVMYNGQLYECNTAISTPEEWTAGHWTLINVAEYAGEQVDELAQSFNAFVSATITNAQIDALF